MSNSIPDRTRSRYAGQYAQSIDHQRLLEIFDDSRKIALGSKNPETAQARFELAVEVYHQLASLGLPAALGSSVQGAMALLADQFPAQVCLNEALGLREKARKLKSRQRKLEYLHRARQVLETGGATNASGAADVEMAHRQVLEEIALVEEVAGKPTTATEGQ